MLHFLLLLLLQACISAANTEKIIFLGPPSLHVPSAHPTLEDLKLVSLSPLNLSIRTYLQAQFPTNGSQHGHSSWILLHSLNEGQRYEVRVCWAATQPTSFRMDTYELQTVFETPELVSSLANFAESSNLDQKTAGDGYSTINEMAFILFLRIQAAADYYTMNQTLMRDVPPVFVDIILDPFILNLVPKSLIPTAGYIIVLAIGSWYLSKAINRWILIFAMDNRAQIEKKVS